MTHLKGPFLNIQNGEYHSPEYTPGLLTRMFPTLAFYIQIIRIVFNASAVAKKGKYDMARWSQDSYNTIRAIEKTGGKLHITGLEKVAALETPCVFVANHMSVMETFIMSSIVNPYRYMAFVVKKSLTTYPVFRHVMVSVDPIVVGRENPREDLAVVLKDGQDRLESGKSVFIFPQRTRTLVFNPETFNTIGIKLAKRAGVPIMPVALKTDAWGQGKMMKDFGAFDPKKTIHIAFGKPMNITGAGKEEHQKAIDFILEHNRAWQDKD